MKPSARMAQRRTSIHCRALSARPVRGGRPDGQLQIAVLAHDTSTLPPGRTRDYYGATPHTWSPYRPDYPQPVADYARS